MGLGPEPAGLPPGGGELLARGAPPPVVRRAARVWVVVVQLGVVMSVVGFTTGFFRVTARSSSREAAALLQGFLALVVAVVSVGWWTLTVFLAYRVRAGEGYARA